MALPSTGSISLNAVNVELSLTATAKVSLNDTAVRTLAGKTSGAISMADLRGKSSAITKTVTAAVTNLDLSTLFTTSEWTSTTAKQAIIAAGVVVGSNSSASPALRTGTGAGGSLKLIILGSVDGAGGATNSGVGGDAIQVEQNITIDNQGLIRAGGGGGGIGGKGGNGQTTGTSTVREPTSGENYQASGTSNLTYWETDTYYNSTFVYFGSNGLNGWVASLNGVGATSLTAGGWTYYRGALRYSSSEIKRYAVYRTKTATTTVTTEGGTGGAGGRGQGSDGSQAVGAAGGAAVGTAGAGGKGGDGGAWGLPGGSGEAGSNGNVGSGVAGSAGGAAGKAVRVASGTVTWVNLGEVKGEYQ